jgi:hypothetical protein
MKIPLSDQFQSKSQLYGPVILPGYPAAGASPATLG